MNGEPGVGWVLPVWYLDAIFKNDVIYHWARHQSNWKKWVGNTTNLSVIFAIVLLCLRFGFFILRSDSS